MIPIGVADSGVTHSASAPPDPYSRVRMARDAGVFDFINRSPPDEDFRKLLRASEDFGFPVLAGTCIYTAGRDEPVFERNIIKARLLGSKIHDIQLTTRHADGHALSDAEVADIYLRFYDFAARHAVTIGFETHVNTWTEHYGRVSRVAEIVERRGIPFGLTFDPSHVIFKIDNPAEQRVQLMHEDVESGSLILDPSQPGNVLERWIDAGYVVHCHARAAVPANPVNIWATHPDGTFGRGIQYPLTRPQPGEWHSAWTEARLEPWKRVIVSLLRSHAERTCSRLHAITCEFIPAIDYGGGAKYSILDQNVACARWLRAELRALELVDVSRDDHRLHDTTENKS